MIRLYSSINSEVSSEEVNNLDQIDIHAPAQWLDLESESESSIRNVLEKFGIHELAIQDALRERHPPKMEVFDDQLFVLYKGIKSFREGLDIEYVQLAFFITRNTLISVHLNPSIGINFAKEQSELSAWLKDPALLLCKILNTSALKYLDEILKLEDKLGALEDGINVSGNDEDLSSLIGYKTKLRRLRRTGSYHEKIVAEMFKITNEKFLFHESDHVFQDLHDKFERIHSLTSMYYDLCGDLIDGYLSLTSHRLNKTMQVLTVITAIFVPLGLLAGIYGMNFDHIPELHVKNGYYILLATMAVIASSLFFIFKRNRWLD